MGQGRGHWHATLEKQIAAHPPVTKIRESHDCLMTHPQHFRQHQIWTMNGLQCLSHQHIIKSLVLNIAQALINILFNDIDAMLEAFGDIVLINFKAVAVHVFCIAQVGQQRAIATAKIQHPGAVRNPGANNLQVRTQHLAPRH